jgi:isoquinoline 1-oxidoreductase alpha subunit
MLEFTLNGRTVSVSAPPDLSLLTVLRDDLDLTGTKYGCGEGQCGACTVLVDGQPRRACLTEVGAVSGSRITTIEGLATEGVLHPLQQAFLDEDAMQCAFCTPGMILAGVALLEAHPTPTRDQIQRAMRGNICRCGTYGRIIAAVERAAGIPKEASHG